jgi:hypothetical protein
LELLDSKTECIYFFYSTIHTLTKMVRQDMLKAFTIDNV